MGDARRLDGMSARGAFGQFVGAPEPAHRLMASLDSVIRDHSRTAGGAPDHLRVSKRAARILAQYFSSIDRDAEPIDPAKPMAYNDIPLKVVHDVADDGPDWDASEWFHRQQMKRVKQARRKKVEVKRAPPAKKRTRKRAARPSFSHFAYGDG